MSYGRSPCVTPSRVLSERFRFSLREAGFKKQPTGSVLDYREGMPRVTTFLAVFPFIQNKKKLSIQGLQPPFAGGSLYDQESETQPFDI